MENKLATYFVGVEDGPWIVQSIASISGETLPPVSSIKIIQSAISVEHKNWCLAGVAGHARYTTREEKNKLVAQESSLGRAEATRAALIPIKKSPEWWQMTQDERRKIFEEQSQHIAKSMKYLPAIARKLYHSRDLGQEFDFLTWFEFSPEHEFYFNELLRELRSSFEWSYVTREIDVRLRFNDTQVRYK